MSLCLSVYLSVCMFFCMSVCPRSSAQLATSRRTCSGLAADGIPGTTGTLLETSVGAVLSWRSIGQSWNSDKIYCYNISTFDSAAGPAACSPPHDLGPHRSRGQPWWTKPPPWCLPTTSGSGPGVVSPPWGGAKCPQYMEILVGMVIRVTPGH